MKIYKTANYYEMSRKAANIISAQVILYPRSVLGLATGSTPVGVYEQLIRWYDKGDIDFSQVHTINLDEYCGVPGESVQSYCRFMQRHFLSKVNIKPAHAHIPDGMTTDVDAECRRYDALIEALGGIDLQLLGIGHNGHIGFNEPGAAFEKMTHCVALKDSTRRANARFFDSHMDVPEKAVTVGIRQIMWSKQILLIASGKEKQDILHQALHGPVTPQVPASILQMHPRLTVVYSE
ncbi:MAG: glucosamine-6-phosphate deaminase [Clostridiales bacterium]|nr:glucosamine-6-phosphate deaminase [Clostridiales bacterium]